jgi:hypothetical protein
MCCGRSIHRVSFLPRPRLATVKANAGQRRLRVRPMCLGGRSGALSTHPLPIFLVAEWAETGYHQRRRFGVAGWWPGYHQRRRFGVAGWWPGATAMASRRLVVLIGDATNAAGGMGQIFTAPALPRN